MSRRKRALKRQPRGPRATATSLFGTADGLRSLLRTGPVKMQGAYVQPNEVPFSADAVREAVAKLRPTPEQRAAQWEDWAEEEAELQREWDEWARDAVIEIYGAEVSPEMILNALILQHRYRHTIEP